MRNVMHSHTRTHTHTHTPSSATWGGLWGKPGDASLRSDPSFSLSMTVSKEEAPLSESCASLAGAESSAPVLLLLAPLLPFLLCFVRPPLARAPMVTSRPRWPCVCVQRVH